MWSSLTGLTESSNHSDEGAFKSWCENIGNSILAACHSVIRQKSIWRVFSSCSVAFELLQVVNLEDKDWYEAEIGGEKGVVPSTYLQMEPNE